MGEREERKGRALALAHASPCISRAGRRRARAAGGERGREREGPARLKRSAVWIETLVQWYGASPYSLVLFPGGILTLVLSSGRRALAGLYPERLPINPPLARLQSLEAEANTRRALDAPPTEDADRLSATNSEVESAMNHRRRRTVLRDACFSPEALDAFNSADVHLLAAQNGLARATEQYVKDIRVRKFDSYTCQ